MKIIICFPPFEMHLPQVAGKGTDYSWHVQHLLREFGCGHFADRGRVPALSKAFADAGAKAYVKWRPSTVGTLPWHWSRNLQPDRKLFRILL